MLFVRNPTGVSHSPAEHAETADCLAGVEAARPRRRGAGVTAYWCEYAQLPDATARSRRRADRGRRRADHRRSSRAPTRGRVTRRLAGAGAARLRERPLARLPPRAAGPHPRRRRHLLDVARADVRRRRAAGPRQLPARSPAPRTPRWRWPGVTCVGEFHYLHHPRRRRPLRRPERDVGGAGRRPPPTPACGSPCSTPATSPAAWTRAATCRWTTSRCGSPTATPTRGRARVAAAARARPGCGSAPRSTRCARCRRRSSPTVVAAAAAGGRCTCTSRSSRPRTRPAWRSTAARRPALLAERRRARPAHHRGARHPPRPHDDVAALGGSRTAVCACPSTEADLADGVGPFRRAAGRRLAAVPGQRPARRDRPDRRGPAAGAARAAGDRRARRASGPPSCSTP